MENRDIVFDKSDTYINHRLIIDKLENHGIDRNVPTYVLEMARMYRIALREFQVLKKKKKKSGKISLFLLLSFSLL